MSIPMSYHSDRKKNPDVYQFDELTFDEVKALSGHVELADRNGKVRTAKVTSVKTWKRRPLDAEVHLKYGMYDFFYLTFTDGKASSSNRGIVLVKRVSE